MSLPIDDDSWVRENPVYCPVPWCKAHKLRTARCGDADGDYDGIHVGRVRAVQAFMRSHQRRVSLYKEIGVGNPERAAWSDRVMQDAIDAGLTPGRKGRR